MTKSTVFNDDDDDDDDDRCILAVTAMLAYLHVFLARAPFDFVTPIHGSRAVVLLLYVRIMPWRLHAVHARRRACYIYFSARNALPLAWAL